MTLPDKKAFYQSWIAQFTTYPDMKVEGEQRFVDLLKKTNDPDADAVQRDIILENRSTGFDLGIEGSFGAISQKIEAQDWDGAKLEYEKAVRDFNEQGGSTFFYGVIQPYVSSCVRHGQIKLAGDGLKFTEDRMSFNDGSIVSEQFDDLKDWVATLKSVTDGMGKWLGEMDGGKYEQCWNESAKDFQENVALDKWVDQMTKTRQPWGTLTSRQLVAAPMYTRKTTSPSGKATLSQYVVGEYNSVFDSQPYVDEKVIFVKNADGVWQQAGYQMKLHADDQPAASSGP